MAALSSWPCPSCGSPLDVEVEQSPLVVERGRAEVVVTIRFATTALDHLLGHTIGEEE